MLLLQWFHEVRIPITRGLSSPGSDPRPQLNIDSQLSNLRNHLGDNECFLKRVGIGRMVISVISERVTTLRSFFGLKRSGTGGS